MSNFIPIICPKCGASANANPGAEQFTCAYCGATSIIPPEARTTPEPLRPVAAQPRNVNVEVDESGVRLIQRWFSLKYVPMAIFAIAWDSFLCFWYSMGLSSGGEMPWIYFVFPIAHVAVGIGITYSTLAGFLNRTVVELSEGKLTVWFGPLPWLGEKSIPIEQIKQLYCVEVVERGSESNSVSYELRAITQDNRSTKLMAGLDSPDSARFIEYHLEGRLNIQNQPVAGEI